MFEIDLNEQFILFRKSKTLSSSIHNKSFLLSSIYSSLISYPIFRYASILF